MQYPISVSGFSASYCGFSTLLEDGLALQLEVAPGNCTVELMADPLSTNRLARLIWAVVTGPPANTNNKNNNHINNNDNQESKLFPRISLPSKVYKIN